MSSPATSGSSSAEPLAALPAVVTLRPIATPLSLGFAALVVASFTVAGLELKWIDPFANSNTVGLTVLAFAVPLQFVSAIYGLLVRDPIAATGLGILGEPGSLLERRCSPPRRGRRIAGSAYFSSRRRPSSPFPPLRLQQQDRRRGRSDIRRDPLLLDL